MLDNIAFGLRVRPWSRRPSRQGDQARALELLDLVQLSGLEKRYPVPALRRPAPARRVRACARHRAARAPARRAVRRARRQGATDLRRWLREIHDKTGHTTVFVTHDQEEALELADRVVVMSEGRIEQIGTPDEIYDRPDSPFVFSFIGELSVLPVRIDKGKAWIGDHSLDLAVDGLASGRLNCSSARTTSKLATT